MSSVREEVNADATASVAPSSGDTTRASEGMHFRAITERVKRFETTAVRN